MYYYRKLFRRIIILLVIIVAGSADVDAASQDDDYSLDFVDSLSNIDKKAVLLNNLHFRNLNSKPLKLFYRIEVPSSYSTLRTYGRRTFSLNDTILLMPDSSFAMPLNLITNRNNKVGVDTVKIEVSKGNTGFRTYYIRIYSTPDPSFAVKISERVESQPGNGDLKLPLYIQNTGNCDEEYVVKWRNSKMRIHGSEKFSLRAGKDTNLIKTLKLRPDVQRHLAREHIELSVKGARRTYNSTYEVTNLDSMHKQHRLPYTTIPLIMEGGAMSLGRSLAYYGAIQGSMSLGDQTGLSFYYRSKQMGDFYNGFQQNVFRVGLTHKKWELTLGQINPVVAAFPVIGQGLGLRYRNDEMEFAIAAIKRITSIPFYQNDNYSASVKYMAGKRRMLHQVMANQDLLNKVNSYLVQNSLELINNSNLQFSLLGGFGMEEYGNSYTGMPKNTSGYSFGYNGIFQKGMFNIRSSLNHFDRNFPGFSKGLFNHVHELRLLKNKVYGGVFFSSNFQERVQLRDSFYNADVLRYNVQRFGILAGISRNRLRLDVRTGKLEAGGFSNSWGLSRMAFFDVTTFYSLPKWSFQWSNLNGFSSSGSEKIFITTNVATVTTTRAGLGLVYARVPRSGFNEIDTVRVRYTETFDANVFYNYTLFQERLTGSVRYNFSKTLLSDRVTNGLGANINFNDPRSKTALHASFFIPLSNTAEEAGFLNRQTVTISLSKQLNIPVIVHRKYHDLRVALFHDLNGNSERDEGEPAIAGAELGIQNIPFITDAGGSVVYKNIYRGIYKLDFRNTRSDLLIPAGNVVKFVDVRKNTRLNIPFRRGKAIEGTVDVVNDSLSKAFMEPSRLKIIVSDTLGNIYEALTDQNGHYIISVPEGRYTVSMNADAFKNSSFKPVQMSFDVFVSEEEKYQIDFTIQQKKRGFRMKMLE